MKEIINHDTKEVSLHFKDIKEKDDFMRNLKSKEYKEGYCMAFYCLITYLMSNEKLTDKAFIKAYHFYFDPKETVDINLQEIFEYIKNLKGKKDVKEIV